MLFCETMIEVSTHGITDTAELQLDDHNLSKKENTVCCSSATLILVCQVYQQLTLKPIVTLRHCVQEEQCRTKLDKSN